MPALPIRACPQSQSYWAYHRSSTPGLRDSGDAEAAFYLSDAIFGLILPQLNLAGGASDAPTLYDIVKKAWQPRRTKPHR